MEAQKEQPSTFSPPLVSPHLPVSSISSFSFMAPTTSLSFKVTRRAPELIVPSKPTPKEYKLLSDIDDQEGLRFHMPFIQFYRKDSSLGSSKDPVEVIREAIAKTLVFYYPFAGRLREGPGRKLGVDCTGEGVMFIEADAGVKIEEFGEHILPPFPCLEELIFPISEGVFDCPLLLIQVTRMKCGGLVFAIGTNHTMCDAFGTVQFMKAVAEIARGEPSPSFVPVWRRELLNARDPPLLTSTHRAYDQVPETSGAIIPLDEMVHGSFFFGPSEIAAIRSSLPPHHGRKPSTFEILTAYFWRCHAIALRRDVEAEDRIQFVVNGRGKFQSPPLPAGYYGNTISIAAAISPTGKICQNPLGYVLELVMKAKDDITEEHMRSLADFLVIKGRPAFRQVETLNLSDLTRVGFGDVDFGWGRPAYGGPVGCVIGTSFFIPSFFIPHTNAKGELGIALLVCLPGPAMKRFEVEVEMVLKFGQSESGFSSSFIKPAL